MTSGSTGSYAQTMGGLTPPGLYFYKSWDGGDGRYETVDGRRRWKWNNYTTIIASRSRGRSKFTVWYNSGPADPNPLQSFEETANVSLNGFGQALSFSSSDQQKLLSQLLEKVKNHEFNLAVNLGEMKQTVGMLSENLRKLGRSMLALKRGDFATAARQLGSRPRGTRLKGSDVAGRWLELQYGWVPLISESYEAARAFAAMSNGPRAKIVRTKIWKAGQFEGSQSPTQYSHVYNEKLERHLQYEMYEELSAPRQLGLMNPASVLWELLPYSFVVDWFVPIGTYLENLNQIPRLKGRFLTTDVRRRTGWSNFHVPGDLPRYLNGRYVHRWEKPPIDTFRETEVTRKASTALTVPLPSFRQGLEINLQSKRMWNAIALAYQRFT